MDTDKCSDFIKLHVQIMKLFVTNLCEVHMTECDLPRHISTKVSEKSAASIFRVEKSAHTSEIAMLVYQTIWRHSQKIVIFKILRVTVADTLITNQGALDHLLKENPRSSVYARLARNCPSIRARTSVSLPLNLESTTLALFTR